MPDDGTIFINYRRDDSRGDAGRLYDRLQGLYPGRVFRDVGFLEPGVQWHDAIAHVLGEADACIVVIGKRWLTVTDSAGKRRLDNPRDTVRQEILTALNNGMRIFPVLVGDADMPAEEDLPPDLQPLLQRNAIELTEPGWDEDFNRLLTAIERALGWSPEVRADEHPTGPRPTAAAGHVAPEITARSTESPPDERAKSNRGVLAVMVVLLLAGGLGFAAFRGGLLRSPDPQRPPAAPAGSVNAIETAAGPVTPGPVTESSTPTANATREPLPSPASTENLGRSRLAGRRSVPAPAGEPAASSPARSGQAAGSTEPLPQNPTVFFRCAGAPDVCAALRAAFDQALEKESLPSVRSLDRAEIVIAADVSMVDQRIDRQFDTTFNIRTYSIDLTGEASRWSASIPMPAPRTVSFDPTFGRDRLAESAYVIAESAVVRVQVFWKRRVP